MPPSLKSQRKNTKIKTTDRRLMHGTNEEMNIVTPEEDENHST